MSIRAKLGRFFLHPSTSSAAPSGPVVSGKLVKEKYRVATQAMDFELEAALPPQH